MAIYMAVIFVANQVNQKMEGGGVKDVNMTYAKIVFQKIVLFLKMR